MTRRLTKSLAVLATSAALALTPLSAAVAAPSSSFESSPSATAAPNANDVAPGASMTTTSEAAGGLTAQAAAQTAPAQVRPSVAPHLPLISPPGSNDFGCKPSAAKPNPVVLVHGTFENALDNWLTLSPTLKADGYCVFALNFGGAPGSPFQGVNDIPTSAGQLGDFVDAVVASTGASKVDILGHSQGGMMPRYYLKNLGGGAKVDKLVALAPSNYGTDFNQLLRVYSALPDGNLILGIPCRACVQQSTGSRFLTELNAGGDTVPGVTYTVIATKFDEVVTPYTNSFLRDPGVTNTTVQDACRLRPVGHIGVNFDPVAHRLARNALDPSTARTPSCLLPQPRVGAAS